MADEFDMSFFQDRALDHGCFSPLSMLCPHAGGWPARLVPLQVGVLQFPIPTARRCFKLGQAIRMGEMLATARADGDTSIPDELKRYPARSRAGRALRLAQ